MDKQQRGAVKMNMKRSLFILNKRKKVLIEYRNMLVERITLNKRIRAVQKELDALDNVILHED